MSYIDRTDAGRVLARALEEADPALRSAEPVVLGLPRGGVPVAYEVAEHLDARLDVIVVRKLGAPRNPELAMGALGEDGVEALNDEVIRGVGATPSVVRHTADREHEELARRLTRIRRACPRIPLEGRVAVLVDDGMATGATALAACRVARAAGAARIVLAVPVAAPEAVARTRTEADLVICPLTPTELSGVGAWYADFGQTPDHVVDKLLVSARDRRPHRPPHAPRASR